MKTNNKGNYKHFKNKKQMIISFIIFAILIFMFIYLGSMDYNKKEEKDNTKFANEYKILDTNNVYKFTNHTDIFSLFTSKSDAIILFGHKKSKWMNKYAEIVNNVAKKEGIKEIYYYDFSEDRNNRNATYEAILGFMDNYVIYNDLDVPDIYAPTLVVVKNKNIIYFDDRVAIREGNTTPDVYWSSYQVELFEKELCTVFKEFLNKE